MKPQRSARPQRWRLVVAAAVALGGVFASPAMGGSAPAAAGEDKVTRVIVRAEPGSLPAVGDAATSPRWPGRLLAALAEHRRRGHARPRGQPAARRSPRPERDHGQPGEAAGHRPPRRRHRGGDQPGRPDRAARRHDERHKADRRPDVLEERLHRPGHRCRPARLGRPAGQRPDDPQQAGDRPGPLAGVAGLQPDAPGHVRARHAHGRHHRRAATAGPRRARTRRTTAASSAWRRARGWSASSWPTPAAAPTCRR